MAVLEMDVDVAERSVTALIESDQTVMRCKADIGRHRNQQRQRRQEYQNQRQQHGRSPKIKAKVSRHGC